MYPGKLVYELPGDRQIGSLVVPADVSPALQRRLRQRVVPALEALLAAALERDRLQAEVVETRALRAATTSRPALLRGALARSPHAHRDLSPRIRGDGG